MDTTEKQFGSALADIVAPALAAMGFVRDPRRSWRDAIFRRIVAGGGRTWVQIVEFQVGRKSRRSLFTVNLGVFTPQSGDDAEAREVDSLEILDCLYEMTRRLGFLFDPPRSWLARALRFNKHAPFDYWWTLSDHPAAMCRTVNQMKECLLIKGVPWLERMSSDDKLDWALELGRQRRDRIVRQAPPT